MDIPPLALSSTQNVTLAVALLVVASVAMIATACYAIWVQSKSRDKLTDAATGMSGQAQTTVDTLTGSAATRSVALDGAGDFVKALGEFAKNLSSLSTPVAALVVSAIPLFLAATLVGIQVLK